MRRMRCWARRSVRALVASEYTPGTEPAPWRLPARRKLARKLEEHADEVVAAYLAGIRSNDPHQAYKAAEAWLSRVHGRPTQSVETRSADGEFPEVAALSSETRRTLLRSLAAQHPHLARELGIEVAADDEP
jgi:uncharacterized protein HemY